MAAKRICVSLQGLYRIMAKVQHGPLLRHLDGRVFHIPCLFSFVYLARSTDHSCMPDVLPVLIKQKAKVPSRRRIPLALR